MEAGAATELHRTPQRSAVRLALPSMPGWKKVGLGVVGLAHPWAPMFPTATLLTENLFINPPSTAALVGGRHHRPSDVASCFYACRWEPRMPCVSHPPRRRVRLLIANLARLAYLFCSPRGRGRRGRLFNVQCYTRLPDVFYGRY